MPTSSSASRQFAPTPASVQEARRFVTAALEGWGAEALVWTAQLVVSELATNAVLHAGTDAFTVRVELQPDGALRLEVHDPSERLPRRRSYGTAATTGRGVALVAELAQEWGVELHLDGKGVWCRLPPPPEGASLPALTEGVEPEQPLDLDAFVGAEDVEDLHRGGVRHDRAAAA